MPKRHARTSDDPSPESRTPHRWSLKDRHDRARNKAYFEGIFQLRHRIVACREHDNFASMAFPYLSRIDSLIDSHIHTFFDLSLYKDAWTKAEWDVIHQDWYNIAHSIRGLDYYRAFLDDDDEATALLNDVLSCVWGAGREATQQDHSTAMASSHQEYKVIDLTDDGSLAQHSSSKEGVLPVSTNDGATNERVALQDLANEATAIKQGHRKKHKKRDKQARASRKRSNRTTKDKSVAGSNRSRQKH